MLEQPGLASLGRAKHQWGTKKSLTCVGIVWESNDSEADDPNLGNTCYFIFIFWNFLGSNWRLRV